MKPFNLEEAKAGKPVCTRDGRDVRIICWDKKNAYFSKLTIVGLLKINEESEKIMYFSNDGSFNDDGSYSDYDLIMKDLEPTLEDFTTIKTYEDACKALKELPIDDKGINGTITGVDKWKPLPKHILALMKLETISRALRNGWEQSYEQDEEIYYPTFNHTQGEISCMKYYSQKSIMIIDANPRLFQNTKDKAKYFGIQFIDLWKEYLMGE